MRLGSISNTVSLLCPDYKVGGENFKVFKKDDKITLTAFKTQHISTHYYESCHNKFKGTQSPYILQYQWCIMLPQVNVCILYSLLRQYCIPEGLSEPSQISKIEVFMKIVNGKEPLNIFVKSSIALGIWLGFE